VRQQVERARFFELADPYRQRRASARETSHRYAGSEVEAEAATLLAEIDGALAALTGTDTGTAERLHGVLEALSESKAPALYEHVQEALEEAPKENPGGDDS